jgi:hypothetical protein
MRQTKVKVCLAWEQAGGTTKVVYTHVYFICFHKKWPQWSNESRSGGAAAGKWSPRGRTRGWTASGYVFRKGKTKSHRWYSSCSFLNLGTRWGEWSASRPGRALPPGKEPPVPTVQEAGWAPEPVWKQRLKRILCLCRESNPGFPVRSHTIHWSRSLFS